MNIDNHCLKISSLSGHSRHPGITADLNHQIFILDFTILSMENVIPADSSLYFID